MKLMFVIVRDTDAENVVQTLTENDFRITRVASSGGFLRRGNLTMMIGTDDDKVQPIMDLIRTVCCPAKDSQHSATVFVVDMPLFEQI